MKHILLVDADILEDFAQMEEYVRSALQFSSNSSKFPILHCNSCPDNKSAPVLSNSIDDCMDVALSDNQMSTPSSEITSTPSPEDTVFSETTFVVRMILSLPMKFETFNVEMQYIFKIALAQATGVEIDSVSIDEIIVNGQRRLLSESISVKTSVHAADELSAQSITGLLTDDNINDNLTKYGIPGVIVVQPAESIKIIVLLDTIYKACKKDSYRTCNQSGNCSFCALCPENMISEHGSMGIFNCTNSTQVFMLDSMETSILNFQNWPRQHSLKFKKGTFDNDMEITIRMVTNASMFADLAIRESSDILELRTSESARFKIPVALTISYAEERVGFMPLIETYDDVSQKWVEVETNYKNDKSLKTVRVYVTRSGFYRAGWKPEKVAVVDNYYREKIREEPENSFSTKLNVFMLFILSLCFLVFIILISRLKITTNRATESWV
jgi:hypothetical protein